LSKPEQFGILGTSLPPGPRTSVILPNVLLLLLLLSYNVVARMTFKNKSGGRGGKRNGPNNVCTCEKMNKKNQIIPHPFFA
jgi:hypothetical protein